MLECVINISEGCNQVALATLIDACGTSLLDIHTDAYHHRSVFTLAGPEVRSDARSLATKAIQMLDIRKHQGVHPRIGVVDVVPFVPLPGTDSTTADAMNARNDFGRWIAKTHGVPAFLYGDERSLPDIRKNAFKTLLPTFGPSEAHETAGACAVGVRGVLVAYNVWLHDIDLDGAKAIARNVRQTHLRTLGLDVGGRIQLSCNLVEPNELGPGEAYDIVKRAARQYGGDAEHGELVGLLPASALEPIAPRRWAELDIDPTKTIEHRLAEKLLISPQ